MNKQSTTFLSACLGNLFEHYDTALFGFLSPFIAPLIFPTKEPITALILTYAMIPLGMLARPIGSLFFGYIGDQYGRRQALFFSLAGMSVVSFAIALSPTYLQAGVIAPIVFGLGRVLQNFLAAGETMGGAIFLLENSSEKKHDLLSGLYNASTIGGILLASAGVALLSHFDSIDKGWRMLYVFGCVTGFFGLIVRRHLDVKQPPSPFFQTLVDLAKVFWACRKPLILIAVSSGFAYANYAMALVLMNGFIPLVSSFTKAQMMGLNTTLLILDFCALPFFGYLAGRVSREVIMFTASFCVVISAIPLVMLLSKASLLGIIGVRICFVLFGVAFFAPFHAWAQQLVVQRYRYCVISFGYAVGSQLLGGPTAAISLWCFKKTHVVSSICWYWVILASISSLAIMISLKAKQTVEAS